MKTLFYLIGGVVCLGLIIFAMYAAMTIGLSVYIAHENNLRGQEYAAKQRADEEQQMRHSIDTLGENTRPDVIKQHDEDELKGRLPSLFADPDGYDTEDNWLATQIGREIAEMAFYAAQPGASLPDLKVKARFDPAQAQVEVEIEGWAPDVMRSELTPAFAWDPSGYAPLARQLVGTTAGVADEPELADNHVLANLLELTGPKLAEEDVRLSANLQAHPASWQDHEAAALLLVALALRNEDSRYADNRPLLCKATAHLALAQVWRGEAHPTWPGLIAGAAIRTIADREVDTLARLDHLSTQADLPDEAKPWIAALRVRTTQDWRKAAVTEKSPLLVKMVWYRILLLDLTPEVAQSRLMQVVPQPAADPALPADQQPSNPETLIPDWGRMAGVSPFYEEGDDSVKNAQYKLDLEFHELDEILKQENAPPFDGDHLATVFAELATDTVSQDGDGKTHVRVIGPGGFKAISLGHIFDGMISKDVGGRTNQDAAQAQDLFGKMEKLFQDVPGYDFARLHLGFLEDDAVKKEYADREAARKTWPVWQVPYLEGQGMPGAAMLNSFYRNVVPFGTAYQSDFNQRYGQIRNADPMNLPVYDSPELEALKKLPTAEANQAIAVYSEKIRKETDEALPKSPQPFELKLLKLDPDNYFLATDYVPNEGMLAVAARFLDYNINPLERIENSAPGKLSDADREMVLRKHAVFDARYYAILSDLLWKEGRDDEAAEADRRDLDDLLVPGASITMILPLVEYELDRGHYDAVEELAKKADLTTEKGQKLHFMMLDAAGKLDEAEAYGKQLRAAKNEWALATLYAEHKDHFPAQYEAEIKLLFPHGMIKVGLADFTEPPQTAAVLSEGPDAVMSLNSPRWRMERAGLQTNEVVVALNGYRVESHDQYDFVKALSDDPAMDFIVFRDPKFVELKASVPHRRLNIPAWSYLPPS